MRYWSSDLHFGHKRIPEFCPGRPGSTIEEMNEIIVANFNAIVKPEDELWILGDIAMGPFKESMQYVSLLNGSLFLVPGNHDRCWSGMSQKERDKNTQIYKDVGFTILDEVTYTEIGGIAVCVSHFPYEGDSHGEDRYPEFRPVDYEHPLIHGHVHDEYLTRASSKGTPMINVGVDVWNYRPVSEETLEGMIDYCMVMKEYSEN